MLFRSRTKCEVLSLTPRLLLKAWSRTRERIERLRPSGDCVAVLLDGLSERSSEYVRSWFPESALVEVAGISSAIAEERDPRIRNLLVLILSNILRSVSFQKDDDLRVRRDESSAGDTLAVELYLAQAEKVVSSLSRFLSVERPPELGEFDAGEGDARIADEQLPELRNKVDAIITSPPYATALPYLDTDRLSLCLLGMLDREHHRDRDGFMIGNREISEATRLALWQHFEENRDALPDTVTKTIDRIYRENKKIDVGFRRRNLPALLSKYFFDMQQVFSTYTRLLKSGASAFVVVGNNHTLAGGKRVEIRTDRYLAELAEMTGLRHVSSLPMEMLVSRDIFKKNAGTAETIIELSNQ